MAGRKKLGQDLFESKWGKMAIVAFVITNALIWSARKFDLFWPLIIPVLTACSIGIYATRMFFREEKQAKRGIFSPLNPFRRRHK